MTPLKITPLPGCTSGTAEKIDVLNRKLRSFIHAPLNLKEILRMEPMQPCEALYPDIPLALPEKPQRNECMTGSKR